MFKYHGVKYNDEFEDAQAPALVMGKFKHFDTRIKQRRKIGPQKE